MIDVLLEVAGFDVGLLAAVEILFDAGADALAFKLAGIDALALGEVVISLLPDKLGEEIENDGFFTSEDVGAESDKADGDVINPALANSLGVAFTSNDGEVIASFTALIIAGDAPLIGFNPSGWLSVTVGGVSLVLAPDKDFPLFVAGVNCHNTSFALVSAAISNSFLGSYPKILAQSSAIDCPLNERRIT